MENRDDYNYDARAKGVLATLFDTSFGTFITTRIISFLFILTIIVAGLASVGFLFLADTNIILRLIGAPVNFFITVLFWRVAFEVMIVVFKIEENTRS